MSLIYPPIKLYPQQWRYIADIGV